MSYYLYRVKFTTSLHIGADNGPSSLSSAVSAIHADTLFSALCIEALKKGGNELLEQLVCYVKNDRLLLSDMFPYYAGKDEEYYIPKPVISMHLSGKHHDSGQQNNSQRDPKAFKKMNYFRAGHMEDYLSFIRGDKYSTVPETPGASVFDPAITYEKLKNMGKFEVRTCVAITGKDETMPFHVGAFTFNSNWGLYFILSIASEEIKDLVDCLLVNLGKTGIGGKRTAGLGKFEFNKNDCDDCIDLEYAYSTDQIALFQMLKDKNASVQISLNPCLPSDDDLDDVVNNSCFMLIRRGGYVQSSSYAETWLKKRELYTFAAGSTFRRRFNGQLADVSYKGNHRVYKYLKPLFLGVNT